MAKAKFCRPCGLERKTKSLGFFCLSIPIIRTFCSSFFKHKLRKINAEKLGKMDSFSDEKLLHRHDLRIIVYDAANFPFNDLIRSA
ncbi:MAG: hypothetical protein PHN49_10970 [Candidatus Omnitrophica bacterium]|nr:hypothetical protein [Candidatus Omnitrophota bacterium]MDD5672150.1 hypothetical protein [Candidatus Omnitrophota bacterium]